MTDEQRAIFDEAFNNIERHRANREEREAELKRREADPVYTERRRPERDNGGLVFKTTVTPTEQPKATSTMDPETLAKWNAWFDDRFAKAVQPMLADFAAIIGEQVAEREKIIKGEVEELRADLALLRAIMKGDVAPLRLCDDAA